MTSAREAFATDGFVVLEGALDIDEVIEPIRRGAHDVIGVLADAHGIELARSAYEPDRFDDGYLELVARDRRVAGYVYDAMKHLPAFVRWASSPGLERLAVELAGFDRPAVSAGGSGVRIDNAGEPSYVADWHQEYVFQLRSVRSCVFWAPLRAWQPGLGGVEVCRSSHRSGTATVWRDEERTPSYQLVLQDDALPSHYELVVPETVPGDLVVMDSLTLHRSVPNTSTVSRWSMQTRWFDYADHDGARRGWPGPSSVSPRIEDVHPELVWQPEP